MHHKLSLVNTNNFFFVFFFVVVLFRSEKRRFSHYRPVEQILFILPVLPLHSPNPTHLFIENFQRGLEIFFINPSMVKADSFHTELLVNCLSKLKIFCRSWKVISVVVFADDCTIILKHVKMAIKTIFSRDYLKRWEHVPSKAPFQN